MTTYGSLELTPAVKQRMLPAWTPQPHTLRHTSVCQKCAAMQQKAPARTPAGQRGCSEERTENRQAAGSTRAPARRSSWLVMQPREVCSTLGDPAPPQVAICIYGALGAPRAKAPARGTRE